MYKVTSISSFFRGTAHNGYIKCLFHLPVICLSQLRANEYSNLWSDLLCAASRKREAPPLIINLFRFRNPQQFFENIKKVHFYFNKVNFLFVRKNIFNLKCLQVIIPITLVLQFFWVNGQSVKRRTFLLQNVFLLPKHKLNIKIFLI